MTTATEGCPKLGIKLINQKAFVMYYKTVKHTSNPIFYSFHFARNAFVQVSCTLILSGTQSKFLTLVPSFSNWRLLWQSLFMLLQSLVKDSSSKPPTLLLCIVVHRSTNFSKMPKHHLYLILQQEGMLMKWKWVLLDTISSWFKYFDYLPVRIARLVLKLKDRSSSMCHMIRNYLATLYRNQNNKAASLEKNVRVYQILRWIIFLLALGHSACKYLIWINDFNREAFLDN